MDLKSYLNWEVPAYMAGSRKNKPMVYLANKLSPNGFPTYKLVFNGAWTTMFTPELTKNPEKREVPTSIAFKRKEKEVYLVFNPPKDIPQYQSRFTNKECSTLQLMNKLLLDDMWTIFDMPLNVTKQYLIVEPYRKIDDKQVWVVTYDPKDENNLQEIAKVNDKK